MRWYSSWILLAAFVPIVVWLLVCVIGQHFYDNCCSTEPYEEEQEGKGKGEGGEGGEEGGKAAGGREQGEGERGVALLDENENTAAAAAAGGGGGGGGGGAKEQAELELSPISHAAAR